jgi:SAM-dependent methyltransferase
VYSSAFCRAYDAFGWNVYPEVFAEQLLRLLERQSAPVRTALDLGCGTGILCRALSEQGIAAAGVDLSAGMIDIARRTAPDCRFFTGDMVTFRPAERFDLVTCTGDALNHVFDPEDVRKVFENVAALLNEGGLFVFDLLRESEIPPDEPFDLEYSDSVRAVFRASRLPGDAVRLHIEVCENGAAAVEEDILEKLHDPLTVCAMLEAAGLTVERCADSLLPGSDLHAATLYIIARKEKKNDRTAPGAAR